MREEKKTNSFLYNLYLKYKAGEQKQQAEEPESDQTEPVIRQEAENAVPVEAPIPADKLYLQPMYDLYCEWSETLPPANQVRDLLSFERWMLLPASSLSSYETYEYEIDAFVKENCHKIIQMREAMYKEEEAFQKSGGEGQEPGPVDASVELKVTHDRMHAFLFLIPPFRGGKDISEAVIREKLQSKNITAGIDGKLIDQVCMNSLYLQVCRVAEGIYPVNGSDGRIVDMVNYSNKVDIHEDQHGNADLRNLHVIHSVTKGQVICEIVPPEKGVNGTDVYGSVLSARDGKPAPVPNGQNTAISPDGTKLISETDGQIVYQRNRFYVAPVLIIKENVDYGVGNIDFAGNVEIYGDVCNGFSVKAGGCVTVEGMVEGASITAGGDIVIKKGVNGNFKGLIESKGMVKTSFLENCTVHVEGCLYSDSIVACTVCCGDSVYVNGRIGVIIGGSITAFRSVEARVIGSKSRSETSIVLGEKPQLLAEKKVAESELKETESVIEKLNKNIHYLTNVMTSLPPDKLEVLRQLEQQLSLYSDKKSELQHTLAKINAESRDFSECHVKSNMIFPPTRITIGSEMTAIASLASKCHVYLNSKGIQIGSF